MYGASVTIADGFKFFVMEFDPEDEFIEIEDQNLLGQLILEFSKLNQS